MPSITVEVTAAQAARIAPAVGAEIVESNEEPRDATAEEVLVWVKDRLRSCVMRYERKIRRRLIEQQVAATVVPFEE